MFGSRPSATDTEEQMEVTVRVWLAALADANQSELTPPLEQFPYCGTGTSLETRLLWVAEEPFPDVAVAKATRDVVAIQHRDEQAHVFAPILGQGAVRSGALRRLDSPPFSVCRSGRGAHPGG